MSFQAFPIGSNGQQAGRVRCHVLVHGIRGLRLSYDFRHLRFTGHAQAAARGPQLVIASSNLRVGQADPRTVVGLVHGAHADVLALQELTPQETVALAGAGLHQLMPYAVVVPRRGSLGLALYSRLPLTAVQRTGADTRSVGGVVTLPGGERLAIRSVHPIPPYSTTHLPQWKLRTLALPGPRSGAGDGATPTILAGDFNATLDAWPLRSVLARGYRDAADQTGNAWRPTWTNGQFATLTLDHVLVPTGTAVRSFAIHNVPGSDHDLIVSGVQLAR